MFFKIKICKILNNENKLLLKTYNANNFWYRLRGLIKRDIDDTTGILITPCSSVHTLFMEYAIDVIFLSKENRVLYIEQQMVPYKFGKKIKKAKKVLEVIGGASKHLNINVGDTLVIEY